MLDTEIIVDRLLQDVLIYFNIPTSAKYSCKDKLKVYTDKALRAIHEVIINDVRDHLKSSGNWDYASRTLLRKQAYKPYGELFNYISFNSTEHTSSFDGMDILEISRDEEIIAMREVIRTGVTHEELRALYVKVDELLAKKYTHNPSVRSYLRGEMKREQFLQCIAFRGYCTNRDGSVYKIPIAESYATGLNNLHDVVIDSVGYNIALSKSKDDIAKASHTGKKISIVTSVVEHIERVDCGSKRYDTVVVGGSDAHLGQYHGTWYLNDKGVEEPITPYHKHLIGKEIQVRSPIYCTLDNPHNICERCFGLLSDNIPDEWNVGKFCSDEVVVTSQQDYLSAKHLLVSAVVANVIYKGVVADYMEIDGLTIRLKANNGELYIKKTEFSGLHLLNGSLKPHIDVPTLSAVNSLMVVEGDNKVKLNLNPVKPKDVINGRTFSLSREFVEYVLDIEVDYLGKFYSIDLAGWDTTKPFGCYTREQKTNTTTIKLFMALLTKAASPETPLHESIKSLLAVIDPVVKPKYAAMAVMAYAYSGHGKGVELPRNKEGYLIGNSHIIAEGTLSAAISNDNPLSVIFNPRSMSIEGGRSHILDVTPTPHAAIEARYGL